MSEAKLVLHSVQFVKELKLLGRPAMSMVSVTMTDTKLRYDEQRGRLYVQAVGSDAVEIVHAPAIACVRMVPEKTE